MINTLTIFEELKENFEPLAAKKLAEVLGKLYTEITNTVTKTEFKELKDLVSDLVKSQKELAEAQKRTEKRVEELAEAQRNSEQRLTRLEQVVGELTEAQRNSEQRLTRLEQVVGELTEAQKRTEKRVEELAEAQKRTEEGLQSLTIELRHTREQVGGLSDTVGYSLENQAYKYLPKLLQKDYGIVLSDRLKRGYLNDLKGRPIEVNIIGEATRNGKKVMIIGESKSRLSKKNINEFIEKRVKMFKQLYDEIFPVIVTHMISEPDAEDYAKENEVAIYYSYDFE